MLNTKNDLVTDLIHSLELLYGLQDVSQSEEFRTKSLLIKFKFNNCLIPEIFNSGIITVSIPLQVIHDLGEAEITKYIGTAVFHGLYPGESKKSNNIRYNALMCTEEVEENG